MGSFYSRQLVAWVAQVNLNGLTDKQYIIADKLHYYFSNCLCNK